MWKKTKDLFLERFNNILLTKTFLIFKSSMVLSLILFFIMFAFESILLGVVFSIAILIVFVLALVNSNYETNEYNQKPQHVQEDKLNDFFKGRKFIEVKFINPSILFSELSSNQDIYYKFFTLRLLDLLNSNNNFKCYAKCLGNTPNIKIEVIILINNSINFEEDFSISFPDFPHELFFETFREI